MPSIIDLSRGYSDFERTLDVQPGEETLIDCRRYFFDYKIFDRKRLVISFEHAGDPAYRPNKLRPGWGKEFLERNKISYLLVKPLEIDWYRGAEIHRFFERLSEVGFFHTFDEVITYGSSMGGYAALCFAGVAAASTVFSLNPQYTLDAAVVPWEQRFNYGRKQDWTGPRSNAGIEALSSKKVYVAYDPFCWPDMQHILGLKAAGVKLIEMRIPFIGHGVPEDLNKMIGLEKLSIEIFTGAFDEPAFYRNIRKRRMLRKYFQNISQLNRVASSGKFSEIVKRHQGEARLV